MWVFDTWAHEGDPLRRSFLESLINYFLDRKWVEEKRWKRQLQELTHRRRRTQIRNKYEITWFAVALAAALLVVPIGHALLRESLPGLRVWLPGRDFSGVASLGLLLAISPLAVAAIAAVVGLFRHRKDAEHRPLDELGALLVQRSANSSTTSTSESTDPTSIEFEQGFRRLMRDALADPRRQAVLVVDNLDRVEPEDAQRIWSTLRTFLDPAADAQSEEWLSRVWVIIPYDPEGILRLWEAGADSDDKLRGARFATSFLDKSVDIRFHVPPPLLANWRDYLIDLLQRALPGSASRGELHRVYRLRALTQGDARQTPTPRELKIFVNQISALYRLRGDEIPLADLAYFVILDREVPDIAGKLLEGTVPSGRERHLVSPNAAENLAALLFGVDREQGQQLLLGRPITDALLAGNGAELQRLQTLSPAFGAVLEHVLGEVITDWAAPQSAETANLLVAAQAISDAKIIDSLDESSRRHILEILSVAATNTRIWSPLSPTIGHGILALNGTLQDPVVAASSISALSESLARSDDEDDLPPSAVGQMAVELGKGLESLGFSDAIAGGMVVPGGADAFLDALTVVVDAVRAENDPNHRYLSILRTTAESQDIVEALAKRASTGSFSQSEIFALRALIGRREGVDWQPLVAAVATRVRSGATIASADEVNVLFAALQHLSERVGSAAARQELLTLFTTGAVAHCWSLAAGNKAEQRQARARLIYTQMLVDPNFKFQQPGAAGAALKKELSDPDPDVTACLAALCENADRRDLLLKTADSSSEAQPLIGEVLRKLYERGNSSSFFSGSMIATRWMLLPKDFALDDLLTREPKRASAVARYIEKSSATAADQELYRAVLRTLRHKKKFASWLEAQVQGVPQADWLKDLRGNERWLKTAVELQACGFGPNLSQPFRVALLEYADELRASSAQPLNIGGKALMGLMDPSDRAIVQDHLISDFLAGAVTWPSGSYRVFGPLVRNHPQITRDGSVLSRVFVPLIEARHVAGVRWIRNLISEVGTEFLDRLDSDRVEAFRRAIAVELRDGEPDQVHEDVKFLAKKIGIRKARRRRSHS